MPADKEVMEYLRGHGVARMLDHACKQLIAELPADPAAFLADHFAGLTARRAPARPSSAPPRCIDGSVVAAAPAAARRPPPAPPEADPVRAFCAAAGFGDAAAAELQRLGDANARQIVAAVSASMVPPPPGTTWAPAGPGETLALSEIDRSPSIMRMFAATTLTFYEGAAPEGFLRRRVADIVRANPWLAGRLVTRDGQPRIWVPRDPDAGQCFADARCDGLVPGPHLLSSPDGFAPLAAHTVKTGAECVDRDEGLFRVTVLRTAPARFALAVSVSHVLGDGHTFYAVYAMLDPAAPVAAMERRTVAEAPAAIAGAIGEEKAKLLNAGSPGIFGFMRNALQKPAFDITMARVSPAWLAAEKRRWAGAQGVPWVSSNDVLTAWFADRRWYTSMAVNFRDRVPCLTGRHAGNYEHMLQFRAHEIVTPADVRRALDVAPRYRTPCDDPIPLRARVTGDNQAVTNWASFYHHIALDGCRHVVHFPLINMQQNLPIGAVCIVFAPDKGELAVLYGEREPEQVQRRRQLVEASAILTPLLAAE